MNRQSRRTGSAVTRCGARARDLERNSDVMNAVLGAYKRNIFGSGYKLRPGTGDSNLDKKISDYWKIWCKKQNCDVTGTQSLNAIMRMIIQHKRVDGGVFSLSATSGGLVPFKLQILEVDELDTTFISPHKKENRGVGGVSTMPGTNRLDISSAVQY